MVVVGSHEGEGIDEESEGDQDIAERHDSHSEPSSTHRSTAVHRATRCGKDDESSLNYGELLDPLIFYSLCSI